MSKVHVFREVNGYSVYVEKPQKDDKGNTYQLGKLQYFRKEDQETIQANTILGQRVQGWTLSPQKAAFVYAKNELIQLNKTIPSLQKPIALEDLTHLEPAEFILANRLKELESQVALSQPKCRPLTDADFPNASSDPLDDILYGGKGILFQPMTPLEPPLTQSPKSSIQKSIEDGLNPLK